MMTSLTRRTLLGGTAAATLHTIFTAPTDAGQLPFMHGIKPRVGAISAVWANSGEDKITQNELRANISPTSTLNRLWDGSKISLFGAKNEVMDFNLVLEAADQPATLVSVRLDGLTGPGGFQIKGTQATNKAGIFSWINRDIELFLIRYLQIKGLSLMGYRTYDEQHIPSRLRRPKDSNRNYVGGWADRPNHDKFYPDIAVPIELMPHFSIVAGQNQSVWADIYIPKDALPGLYIGNVEVREGATLRYTVPVELNVRNFSLPDVPNSKTMLVISRSDVAHRYAGTKFPNPSTPEDDLVNKVVDKHFLVAHRHKISLVDENEGADTWAQTRPRLEWEPRLSGALFTAVNGYKGPGEGVGNNIFVIGLYGSWQSAWSGAATNKNILWGYADQWEQWFDTHHPDVDHFLYLVDESLDYPQIEQWAGWIRNNPGGGQKLRSFATANLVNAATAVPSLDIMASAISVGDTIPWDNALIAWKADPRKSFYMYSGIHPAAGSFVIDDDGVALRELAWGQYKKDIDRWFCWQSTYYNNYQGGTGETNVFQSAETFGGPPRFDAKLGMTAWNYSNGEGVLFYPGTDKVFPAESYELQGPIVSLRLKHWRRGVQDVDYLKLAEAVDPTAVQALVQKIVPKVLWEYGVNTRRDPTWVRAPISWSNDSDDWERAREQLANIIDPLP